MLMHARFIVAAVVVGTTVAAMNSVPGPVPALLFEGPAFADGPSDEGISAVISNRMNVYQLLYQIWLIHTSIYGNYYSDCAHFIFNIPIVAGSYFATGEF